MNRQQVYRERAELILERFSTGQINDYQLWEQCHCDLSVDEHKRIFELLGYVPFIGYPLIESVQVGNIYQNRSGRGEVWRVTAVEGENITLAREDHPAGCGCQGDAFCHTAHWVIGSLRGYRRVLNG